MVSTGFAIYLAVLFLLAKLPRRLMLRLLHYDLAVDLFITVLTLVIHFGTFSGLMAATVAGVLTSTTTTLAKRLFGHITGDTYHPGVLTLKV
jgi:hypothetical protein